MVKNRERGALLTDAEVCDLLKVEGVEIWAKPYDDRPVMLTFGTLKRILVRALRVEAASGAVADGALSDDDMHRLHDQSQMGWGHDWRKFGRLVEAAALSRASSSRDEVEKDAARLKGLRELCGFVQNGSDTVIKIFQDDATREWVVKVGEESYCGRSFGTAIDAALLADAEAGKEE